MVENRELTISDLLDIVRRRWLVICLSAIVAAVIGYLVSFLLPPQFTSQAVVMIERQKVSEGVVKPLISEELHHRLAKLQERVLSDSRLQSIIRSYGLYKKELGRAPMEALTKKLRDSINLTPIQSVGGTVVANTSASSGSGAPAPGTQLNKEPPLGFIVTVTTNNPRTAQEVCAEITWMFIAENLHWHEESAAGTDEFLEMQIREAKRNLDEQTARLAEFERQHQGQLPDEEKNNLTLLNVLNTQLQAATQALDRAQQDKSYFETLLDQELAAWQKSQQGGSTKDSLKQELEKMENSLATMQARYTADHPEVIKLKNAIAELKKKEASTSAADKQQAKATEPPEIQKLRAQLHQAEVAIREQSRSQQELQNRINVYQERVQATPAIADEFKNLNSTHQTALEFYGNLQQKKNQSTMASDLERRQQGEQFMLVDAANLPQSPAFPNRLIFAGSGLGGGLVLGFGIVALLQMRDKTIRNERDVLFYLQLPTLALVPSVKMPNGTRKSFWKRAKLEEAHLKVRAET